MSSIYLNAETCPHCGNVVEGRKIKSYRNKVARQGAKTAVHMVTGVGGTGIGAEIGTAFFPGVGTVVGGALGFIGSAMFNQKVNEGIDKVGDSVEDEFLSMEYEFRCPKCGHTWTLHASDITNENTEQPIGNSIFDDVLEGFRITDNISSTNDEEQEYLEELKEVLADGEISARERRLLDKIRTKLGISEDRAAELEASLSSPSLTPEEQEYLNEYKEIVSEGEISARDQRFLNKLKKTNGISEERAKEIEKLV